MKKTLVFLFALIIAGIFSLPANATTVLRYGASQNNSNGARINYYPNKKPEPQIKYVYVNPYAGSKYDENGYYLSENVPKKRGGGSHVIYSAFPIPRPNFGGGINTSSSPVSAYTTVRSGATYKIGNGALRHPSVSYSYFAK